MINWHLNYEGPKYTNMRTELSAHQSSVGLDLDQDVLVLVPVPPGLDLVPGDDDTN